MLIIRLLAQGLDGTRHSACLRDNSHAYMLDTVKLFDNTRSKRLFKIYIGEMFVYHYFRDVIPK
jgi:hypothetical protein